MTLSNNLFLLSLLLLLLSFFVNGVGRRGMTQHPVQNPTGSITDLQLEHDHSKVIETQNSLFGKLVRSYLFWISLCGILVSVILSKL